MGPFSATFRDTGVESSTREWNFSQNTFSLYHIHQLQIAPQLSGG